MNIDNKTAILTGASGGLGSSIASVLVKNNVKVYGIGRNIYALHELQSKLGNNFIPVQLDITNESKVHNWLNHAISDNNLPDILINNAGVGSFHKVDEMKSEDWQAMINTNLNGMYYLTAPIVALMKKKNTSSHIINIGSILGKVGRNNSSAYCATKFAVQGFSEALYLELRAFNIKVTCINPGSIDTTFFNSSGIQSHKNMLNPDDIANTLLYLLQTPDNMLINEITIRPMNVMPPSK